MSDRPINSACEMMLIISNIQKLRAHCPNLVHTESSRSHLIVTLTVSSKSPNALALGETCALTLIAALLWPHLTSSPVHCSSLQPVGYRTLKGTCSAPPSSSGGVHAVAVLTSLVMAHLINSVAVLPPLPASHPCSPRVSLPGPVFHRLHSGPGFGWWTWQAVRVLVSERQISRNYIHYVFIWCLLPL